MTKTHTVRGDVGMDGSATTSLTERTRLQISRAFVNKTSKEANAQSPLFEQLLNLSFTVQPRPEKQPQVADAPSPKSSSTDRDDNHSNKMEDEKDDASPAASSPVAQVAPLIVDNPLAFKSDQPLAEQKTEDLQLKTTDTVSSKVTEQLSAPPVNLDASQQLPFRVDEQIVVANTHDTDTAISTATTPTNSNVLGSNTASLNASEDTSNKKVEVVAPKTDDVSANLSQEVSEDSKKEPDANTVTKAQDTLAAVKPQSASAHRDEGDDRRGDRREKWFEHKNAAVDGAEPDRATAFEGTNAVQENADPTQAQPTDASQSLPPAAPTAGVWPVDSTTAPPIALPVTVSLIVQSASPSTPSVTEQPTSSPGTVSSVTSAPTRNVGNQTGKSNSNETVTEPGLSQQERVRVIQRIARSFNRISTEGGSISLRLHPEHLGSVSVQVRLEGRSLSARLSTETTAARDAIMQDLPALRQRLADQGFDVTKFQVDVAGNGADASFAQTGGQSQFGQSEDRSSSGQTDYRRVSAMQESRAATTRQIVPGTTLTWQSNTGIDLQA